MRRCFIHFIPYGLDPTLTCEEFPQSALQLAHQHVQSPPVLAPSRDRSSEELHLLADAMEEGESRAALPNLAMEQWRNMLKQHGLKKIKDARSCTLDSCTRSS